MRHFRIIRKNDALFLKMCVFRRNIVIFVKIMIFLKQIPDFPETIPAYFNFAAAHIIFVYPKKLSYSSRNSYIKKIRVRLLGETSSLLKNLKNA